MGSGRSSGALLLGAWERKISPDLVLDVIVRNKGTVGLPITGIQAEVFDWRIKMHGIPGDGLLFPQITYAVSIQGGKSGVYFAQCEPPLIVKATEVERFKIRITDFPQATPGMEELHVYRCRVARS